MFDQEKKPANETSTKFDETVVFLINDRELLQCSLCLNWPARESLLPYVLSLAETTVICSGAQIGRHS